MATLKFKKNPKIYYKEYTDVRRLKVQCPNCNQLAFWPFTTRAGPKGHILEDGATKIQRIWRGFYCRQWYSSLWNAIRGKVCWPEYILEGAAIQIQRVWRSFHSRRDFMLHRVYEETDKLFGRFDGVCRFSNGATAIQSTWRGFKCRETIGLWYELQWLKGIRRHHEQNAQQTMRASNYVLPFSSKLNIRRNIDNKNKK